MEFAACCVDSWDHTLGLEVLRRLGVVLLVIVFRARQL